MSQVPSLPPIAVVCHPGMGGSGIMATELAAGLSRRGHQVHLVARTSPARMPPCGDALTFHDVNAPGYPAFGEPPYTVALADKLARLIDEQGVRVLHVHYALPHAVSAFLAQQIATSRCATVVSLHGTDVIQFGPHPAYQKAVGACVRRANKVTAPSADLAARASEIFQLDTAPAVLANFVDTERYAPACHARAEIDGLFGKHTAGRPTIVHMSNFRPVKNIGDVLKCFAAVLERVPARLLMIGDGPERGTIETACRSDALRDSVRFVGTRPDAHRLLPCADVMLLASAYESFGLAALEALACGTPVVAPRVGGLIDVVKDGQSGVLVTPGDTAAMAAAVERLLSDSALLSAAGLAAREDVLERFDMQRGLRRWELMYASLGL